MAFTIHPRAAIGCPEPPASRAKLPARIATVLAHYVGVPSTTRYLGADHPHPSPEMDAVDARAIAAYGVNAGKSWEYNFMIGAAGTVFEQAGPFRAAHCLGMNDRSIGVLFLLGNGRRPTAQMVAAWHDLLDLLRFTGAITPTAELAPHYRYRATDCPALLAEPPGRWLAHGPNNQGWDGDLIPALLHRETPEIPPPAVIPEPNPGPTPPPPQEDDMHIFRKQGKAAQWLSANGKRAHIVDCATAANLAALVGVPILLDESADLDAVGRVVGADPGDV